MSDFHELIISKLKQYKPEVSRLGLEALKLAKELPEASVAEHLKNVVRQIVREGVATDDPK